MLILKRKDIQKRKINHLRRKHCISLLDNKKIFFDVIILLNETVVSHKREMTRRTSSISNFSS